MDHVSYDADFLSFERIHTKSLWRVFVSFHPKLNVFRNISSLERAGCSRH